MEKKFQLIMYEGLVANVLYTYVWIRFICVQNISWIFACWGFILKRLHLQTLNLSNKLKNHKELSGYSFTPYAHTRGFLYTFEHKEFISFGNNIGWAQEGGLWWCQIFNVGTYMNFYITTQLDGYEMNGSNFLGLVVNQFKSNQFFPSFFPPFGQKKRLKTICIIQLPI